VKLKLGKLNDLPRIELTDLYNYHEKCRHSPRLSLKPCTDSVFIPFLFLDDEKGFRIVQNDSKPESVLDRSSTTSSILSHKKKAV